MASTSSKCIKKESYRGPWTAEEDQKLAQAIEINGAKRWKSIAAKAGLNRCGKSCRLRWMNYLRPNIKRGNISDQEEDLILRLHKLLGNRWSLIAGRLPGRTDNEIKNYWNSHLSKKKRLARGKQTSGIISQESMPQAIRTMETNKKEEVRKEATSSSNTDTIYSKTNPINNGDDCFDCFKDEPLNLEWISKFLEGEDGWFQLS